MAYESTSVPVEKSQGEIRKLLAKHGAQRFAFGEDRDVEERRWAAISFTYQQHAVRIRVPLKLVNERDVRSKYMRARTRSIEEIRDEMYEQEERRIWRVLSWNLKARLVAVEEEVETFEEAFLAHLLTQEGRTIYETLAHDGHVQLEAPLLQLEAGSANAR